MQISNIAWRRLSERDKYLFNQRREIFKSRTIVWLFGGFAVKKPKADSHIACSAHAVR
jgi:hypothetical protein